MDAGHARVVTYAIAIDLGTTALKVGLVSLRGEIVSTYATDFTVDLGEGGSATIDARVWWDAVRDGIRAVAHDDVVAISCTGLWAVTVPCDDAGEPVGPAVLWWDTQGAPHSRKVIAGPVAGMKPSALLRWVRKTGGAPSATGADPIGHMLHLAHDRPDVHANARWYLEPIDWLALRLTGVAAASHASMAAVFLTDNRDTGVLAYDDDLVRRAGIDPSKLPPLVAVGSVVGTVRDGIAADLGLPAGVQVVTGLPDLHTAAIGTGAARDFEAHVAISTSSWVGCTVPFKKTDVLHQIASLPGFRAGSYVVANSHETAGRCLQWARDALAPASSFEDVLALAATSPPGANGVLFTPWLIGERSPIDDRNARGGFHNVSITTTQADLFRAVLEGVASNARWLHGYVEKFCKRRLDPVRIFGGGAVSDLWCQVHADVMDRTIERVADPKHTGLRGAALFAGMALGEVRLDEVRDLVPVERTFRPDPDGRAVHDRLAAELPKLYSSQRAMFRRLNRR